MSDEVKKLEAGEWWECGTHRVRIIGHKLDGVPVIEDCKGYVGKLGDPSEWHHLPDCTGWDWQPETFPQYWTARDSDSDNKVAFVTAEKDKSWRLHYKHGGEYLFTINRFSPIGRTQITKEQAEALRTPICSMCGLSLAIPGTAGCRDCTEFAIDQVRAPVEPPTNQQLFEMIANLRDRMDAINKRLQIVECEVPL